MDMSKAYYPNLDWLRGMSILLVIFHHIPAINISWVHILQSNGRYGVSLFFIISGFLICDLLLKEKQSTDDINLKNFFIRRSLRLFPLYYAVLALYVIKVYVFELYSIENQQIFKDKLLSYLFYFSNVYSIHAVGPFFFAWSLAVEEQFYTVFSPLMKWCKKKVIFFLICVALVAKFLLLESGLADMSKLIWRIVLSYQEAILLGVLFALLYNNKKCHNYIVRTFSSNLLSIGSAATALLIFCFHIMANKSGALTQVFYLSLCCFVGSMTVRPSVEFPGRKLFMHLGKISYGIYLFHMTVIDVSKRVFDNVWLIFAFSLIVTTILCTFVYEYFERPLLKMKKRFSA